MNIAILGAKGMLGNDLATVLQQHTLTLLDIGYGDITKPHELREILTEKEPHVVINCAAFTRVDDCEDQKELAIRINGLAVADIAEICKDIHAACIHISTDYVFDGTHQHGYFEDDVPTPINAYGYSKLVGERILQGEEIEGRKIDLMGLKWYIVRLCWLYGTHGKNFVDTMIDIMKKNQEVKVVTDQWGKPTWTMDAARQIKLIAETLPAPGIYHVSNEGVANRFEWVSKIKEVLGLGSILIETKSSAFPTPAKRPMYSPLVNTKLPPMRSWDKALEEYLS